MEITKWSRGKTLNECTHMKFDNNTQDYTATEALPLNMKLKSVRNTIQYGENLKIAVEMKMAC